MADTVTVENKDDGGMFGFLDTLYQDATSIFNKAIDKIPEDAISDAIKSKYVTNTTTPEKVEDRQNAPKDSALSGTSFTQTITDNKGLILGGALGVLALIIIAKKL